jgi:hypothetical protein
MGDIGKTLAERGTRYGDFGEHARITQAIKRVMSDTPNWAGLADDMRETLEMIAHKVGRILNGDPSYHDSWHDIIGYTKLVADKLDPDAPRLYEMRREVIRSMAVGYPEDPVLGGTPLVGGYMTADDDPPLRAGTAYEAHELKPGGTD